jgi:hypothetical protein
MSNEGNPDVNLLLEQHKNHYKKNATSWKLGYRVFLILSAFLSASAAVVGKLYLVGDEKLASDISAILAGLSAVSTAIVASLNFENFWRSNQKAREKVKILELEALKAKTDDPETLKIIGELQKIIEERAGSLLKDD